MHKPFPKRRKELKGKKTTGTGDKCKGLAEWRVSDLILDERRAFGALPT